MTSLATVPIVVDDDGVATIEGTTILVTDVVNLKLETGMSPEAIHATIPSLSIGDIYAALAYYYSHQAVLDAEMQRRHDEIERGINDLQARNTVASDGNWLKQISGQWPGNETDLEINEALEQLS